MPYTRKQHHYINIFMQHVDVILALLNTPKPTSLDAALDQANQVVNDVNTTLNTTTTVLSIVGIAAAVPTAGLSLPAAGAAIGALKMANEGYKLAKQTLYSEETPALSQDNINAEEQLLSIKILCREVASEASLRYRHMVEEIATEQGVADFARTGAARAMKKIYPLILELPTADVVLDHFNESPHRPKQSFAVNEKYQSGSLLDLDYYTKWAYARPRVVTIKFSLEASPCTFYASPSEARGPQARIWQETTMAKYGYMVLPETALPAYLARQKAQPLSPSPQLEPIKQHLCVSYPVTRTDVEAYLVEVKTVTPSISLNTWLSNRFGMRTIATCHDDTLKGLDLNQGDFSDVNFRRADLRECVLNNTRWTGSHIDGAFFGGIPTALHSVVFNGVTAERSHWDNVDFAGADFSEARMNGSQLNACSLAGMVSVNSLWDLVAMQHMQLDDSFITRLNEEEKARLRIEQRIDALEEQVVQHHAAQAQINAYHDDKIAHLLTKMQASKPQWPAANCPIPAHIPAPLQTFHGAWQSAFKNNLLQQSLHYYIEPDALPFRNSVDTQRTALYARFEDCLTNDTSLLLVHGDAGAGKSSAARVWQQRLWNRWQTASDWVPLVIELKQVQHYNKNFLKACLMAAPYGFSVEQIQTLQKDYRFVIILDGLDECPTASLRNIQADCALHEWNAKILLTARTEWLQAQPDYRRILLQGASSECFIASFTSQQIERYMERRLADSKTPWSEYQALWQREADLRMLATSPVMLHIICEVLPILATQLTTDAHAHNRTWLYDTFLAAWFKREIDKPHELDTVQELDHSLSQHFLNYTQTLAYQMYSQNTLLIERIYHESSIPLSMPQLKRLVPDDPWGTFFDSPDLRMQRAQRSCPLSLERFDKDGIRYHRYQFIHKSIMEHAAASYLHQALNDQEHGLTIWNQRFLTEELGILAFLTERLIASPTRERDEEKLVEMIYASRKKPDYAKAASSAITLLNKTRFDFHNRIPDRDLSEINIPHADLSEGLFQCINLSGSDLSDVYFHNVLLVGGSLARSNLTGARFLAGTAFLLMDILAPARVLVRHPLHSDIVAYNKGHYIIIAHLSNGHIERCLSEHLGNITSMAFAPNGILASGCTDGRIIIWDIQRPEKDACLHKVRPEPNSPIQCLAFSPDGKLASSCESEQFIRLWNIECNAHKLYITHTQLAGHTNAIRDLAFSPDGTLASASLDQTIRLWAIHQAADEACFKILDIPLNDGEPSILAFANDGMLASGHDNGNIKLWDIQQPADQACFQTLNGHSTSITCLDFAADGTLASGSKEHNIRLWDVKRPAAEACIQTFAGHTADLTDLSFAPNGTLASSSEDRTIRIWDRAQLTQDNGLQTHAENTQHVLRMASSPDGMLAVGDYAGNIYLWNIQQGICVQRLEGHTDRINALVFAADGTLISASGDKTIRLWDIQQPEGKPCFKILEGHLQPIFCMALAPDGTLASGDKGGTIFHWDIQQPAAQACLNTMKGSDTELVELVFTPNGTLLSNTGLEDANRFEHTQPTAEVKATHPRAAFAFGIAFAPDGTIATTGIDDRTTIHLWNNQDCFKILKGQEGDYLAFTADGRWLISATSEGIIFWNAKNWEEAPHRLPFGGRNFSLHGNWLNLRQKNSMHTLDLTDFPRTYRWIQAMQPQLWLQGCDVSNVQGILRPSQQLFTEDGAVVVAPEATEPPVKKTRFGQYQISLFTTKSELSKSTLDESNAKNKKNGPCNIM